MKKVIIILIVLPIFILLSYGSSRADIAVVTMAGYGFGGIKSNQVLLLTVYVQLNSGLLLGFDGSTDFKGTQRSDVYSYTAVQLPVGTYSTYNDHSSEYVFSAVAGYQFNKYFGLLGGIGMALNNYRTIAIVNNTNQRYYQRSNTTYDIEASVQAVGVYKMFTVQAGYSLRRGVVISAGVKF